MKQKGFVLLLTLILVLALCACGAEDLEKLKDIDLPPLPTVGLHPEEEAVSSEIQEPTQTAAPVELGEEPAPSVIVRIESTNLEQYDPAEGTQLILSFAYDTPLVNIDGNEAAAAKINESVARINETFYTGESYGEETEGAMPSGYLGMLEAAEDNFYINYYNESDLPLEYSSTHTARVERIDDKLLCLVFTDYSYTGGAHGSYVDRAYLYSTQTGERLRLEDLAENADDMRAYLRDSMLNSLDQEQKEYYSSYLFEKELSQALEDLVRDGSFFLDENGLVIFSDIYEIASYADGIVSFVFPYDQLHGYLKTEWFPEERSGEGELEVMSMTDVPDGSVWIIDRLAIDEVGEEWCLLAKGTVYDLTGSFYEHAQLWKTSLLSNSALQIRTDVPDGLPNLMIRYRTADGEEHVKLLSQSGEDGHPMLVDDTVEAVG